MTALALGWQQLRAQDWPADVQQAIAAFSRLGEILCELLQQQPAQLDDEHFVSALSELQEIYQPWGEYMVAPVPALLDWLQVWRDGER